MVRCRFQWKNAQILPYVNLSMSLICNFLLAFFRQDLPESPLFEGIFPFWPVENGVENVDNYLENNYQIVLCNFLKPAVEFKSKCK